MTSMYTSSVNMLVSTMLMELRNEMEATGMLDMGIVDDLIDKVQDSFSNSTPRQDRSSVELRDMDEFIRVCDGLLQGKRLSAHSLEYRYPPAPVVRIFGTTPEEVWDEIELECVSGRQVDAYELERSILYPSTVMVTGYTEQPPVPIEYIYVDQQAWKIRAHLMNGDDVEYNLNILESWKVGDEFQGVPSVSEDDTRSIRLGDLRAILQDNYEGTQLVSIWDKVLESLE